MVEGVVNELSFRKADEFKDLVFPDANTARIVLSGFVQCISEGLRRRLIVALRTDESFPWLDLAPGYSLAHWRNDSRVNRDERALFRSFLTATPYLSDTDKDIQFRQTRAAGLSSCRVRDAIAISLDSEDIWNCISLPAQLLTLSEDGELRSTMIEVRNVTRIEHWDSHAEWIRAKLLSDVTTGAKLLEHATVLFPNLRFGLLATKQLSVLNGSEHHFAWIVSALSRAEGEVAKWDGGMFMHARLPGPASGESQTVRESPRLNQLRIFETSRGKYAFCEYHMKQRGENQRIHYLLDEQERKMQICYVGQHLETATF